MVAERKKETHGRGLVVKGIGYVSPLAQTEKSSTSTSVTRHAKRPPRGPFVMPSAPIKAGPASGGRVAMTPNVQRSAAFGTSSTRFGSMSNLTTTQKDEQCRCQHPADVEFLQDVYLENMRIKLEMLEMENKYLKGGSVEDNEMAGPSSRTRTSVNNKKRVEFADRRLFSGNDSIERQSSVKQSTTQPSSDQDLFDKLEEAYQKEFRLQEKLKAMSMENKKLMAAKEEAERQLGKLNSGEKSSNRERHILMEDNVQLQRRLDDLTPLLAAKDAEIQRLEMDKTNLIGKIRRLSTGTATKHDREVDDMNANRSVEFRRQELLSRNDEIEKLESRVRQFRQKENEFNDEITNLKRKLKEEQMLIKREQSLRENYAQENEKLIKENSELVSKLNRTEMIVERQDADKVSKAQLSENMGRMENEISTLEKRLKNEIENRHSIEEQLRRQEQDENQFQDSRRKMQEELHALKVLSDSLSAENQGLRQEKLSITQRMEMLFEKLEDKEKEIRHLTQLLEDFYQRYLQSVERLQSEAKRQSDAGSELSEIVNQARKLSSSNFTQNGSSLRASSVREMSVEESTIKSPQRQHSSLRSSPIKHLQNISEDEISRHSSATEEISEKDARPILSPLTSPIKPSSSAMSRQQINRSLRNVSHQPQERGVSRTYSEDRQSTASSLAQKYRRKLS